MLIGPSFLAKFSHRRIRLCQTEAGAFPNEFGRTCGTERQPAKVTRVHVPEGGQENVEEQTKKAASRRKWSACAKGAAVKGLQLVLFLMLLCLPRNAGEGKGDEFNSPRGRKGSRGRLVRKEKNGDECRSAQGTSRSPRGGLLP